MDNNLTIFKEQEVLGKNFRVFGTPEDPLFLGKDVADWIDHKKPSEMLANVDDDEKIKVKINPSDTIAGVLQSNTEYWFLTENGVYEVLMQSRKPIAKQFKKQVKEILKSIRKNGAYIDPETLEKMIMSPDFGIKLLTALKEEKDKRIEAESKLIEQQPKVDIYDAVMDDNGLLNFIQVAGLFGECGRNSLMKILRESKILMDGEFTRNVPYSQYLGENGFFEVVVRPRKTKEGVLNIATTLCKTKSLPLIKKVLDRKKEKDNLLEQQVN